MIDLHTHSHYSDGSLSPAELIELAARSHLSAIALTDHDTMDGIPEAREAANSKGIELIPGIELSTLYQGTEVHIVGLDIDPAHPVLIRTLKDLHTARDRRNEEIVEKMQADHIPISMEKLTDAFPDAILTRAHFARFLVECGTASSVADAFKRFLGDGKPYHIPRRLIASEEAVALIRSLGGIPILAHPFQYHLSSEELSQLVRTLKAKGLIGIEAYYSTHSKRETGEILALARRQGLCPSGGSDFHGAAKPDIALGRGFGNLNIEDTLLSQLRKANT